MGCGLWLRGVQTSNRRPRARVSRCGLASDGSSRIDRGVVDLEDWIKGQVAELEEARRWREPQVGAVADPGVADLCSNDYLGLGAQTVSRATLVQVGQQPLGAGASRLLRGGRPVHDALEADLATWVRLESALLFSSGFAANVGVVGGLPQAGDLIVSDALNHASLIDGTRLSRAEVAVVPHLSVEAVARALEAWRGPGVAWVVTESYFSMDADSPDLRALRAVCDVHAAGLVVDEAHALGIFGPEGGGLCLRWGVRPDVLTGGLGKAVGSQGGFAACSAALRALLWNRARTQVFSTAPSPLLAALTGRRLETVRSADAERAALEANWRGFERALGARGVRLGEGRHGPIFPVEVGEEADALQLAEELRGRGFGAQAIRPPTVPEGRSRLRLAISAAHSGGLLTECAEAVARGLERYGRGRRETRGGPQPRPGADVGEALAGPGGPGGARGPGGHGFPVRAPACVGEGGAEVRGGDITERRGGALAGEGGAHAQQGLEADGRAAGREGGPGVAGEGAWGGQRRESSRRAEGAPLGAGSEGGRGPDSGDWLGGSEPPAGGGAGDGLCSGRAGIGGPTSRRDAAEPEGSKPEVASPGARIRDEGAAGDGTPGGALGALREGRAARAGAPGLGELGAARASRLGCDGSGCEGGGAGAASGSGAGDGRASSSTPRGWAAKGARWVVLGCGTGQGKTHFAEALVRARAAAGVAAVGLKPIETGMDGSRSTGASDAARLQRAGLWQGPGLAHPLYAFGAPVAPAAAARQCGVRIDLDRVREWGDAAAAAHPGAELIFETAGGAFSPVSDDATNLDLARALGASTWVLVVGDELGALHAARACLVAMGAEGRRPDWLVFSAARVDHTTGLNAAELGRGGGWRDSGMRVLTLQRGPVEVAARQVREALAVW